jgi:regulator of protease activity HflC (stomatin/prohibitin superfamily)
MTSPVSPPAQAADTPIAEVAASSTGAATGLLAALGFFVVGVGGFVAGGISLEGGGVALGTVLLVLGLVGVMGVSLSGTWLTIVQPGDTKVLTFFGRYVGTVRRTGLTTVKPLTAHAKTTVRVRNFETGELKVNDADGNPVNIGAIIVWRVVDTAKARFAVDNDKEFVEMQAEAALRHVATAHPYDGPDGEDQPATLRGSIAQISDELAAEVAERVELAGVEIVEARISKLAYAPEIAQAMLQRQQAGAIIAARQKIVDGAVGMVEDALERLERDNVVELDDERRAAMVSNLLVVLAGDSRATPVVNTGSLYT